MYEDSLQFLSRTYGPDPVDPKDYTTKQWVQEYVGDYVEENGGGGGGGVAVGTTLGDLMEPFTGGYYPTADISSATVTSAAPTWSGLKSIAPTTSRFRIGGNIVANPSNYTSGYSYNLLNSATYPQNVTSMSWEADVYGDRFSIPVYIGGTGDYKLLIDGLQVAPSFTHVGSPSGQLWLTYVFATKRVRRVRMFLGALQGWNGIVLGSDGDVWPAERRPRILYTGDSYGAGVSSSPDGSIYAGTIPQELALAGGCEVWNLAQGGTGYIASALGLYGLSKFGSSDRRAALAACPEAEVVLVYGGGNDGLNNASPSAVAAEANAFWDIIATDRPSAKLAVVGIQSGVRDDIYDELEGINTALRDAAAANANVDLFIDQRGDNPWVYGTGYWGAPASDGNADMFVNTDKIHRTHGGFHYEAGRAAKALARLEL